VSDPRFPESHRSIGGPEFDFIRSLVRRMSSIVLDDSKKYLVTSRLLPLAREHGFDSVESLVAHLRRSPQDPLQILVVEAIATTETSFFRDIHPFNALRDQILPELLTRQQKTGGTLNIWSAACSSGQEPYSVAMILKDRFAALPGWSYQILASDISRQMIERAKVGFYSQVEVNRGLPAPYLVRFLNQRDGQWQVNEEIRQMCRFFHQNLAQAWGAIPPVDLVMLRNVLIYFDVETRREVLRRVRRLLRPGGYLLLGSAETTLNLDDTFDRVRFGRAVFYQVRKGASP
jgi:chemotaxis protein methyltransferase CheR